MELAAGVAVAAAAAVGSALLAALCADHGDAGADDDTRVAEPLIVRGAGRGVGDAYQAQSSERSTASASSSSAASTRSSPPAPAPLPKFKSRAVAGDVLTPVAGDASSAIFCRCGGNGALVKLLPCGHQSLCLACCQLEKKCPTCSAPIEDSVPSFRVA